MNKLDHLVTKNFKNNKYRSNDSINSEPAFDISNFNLSIGTSNPLTLITVSLRGAKKHRVTTVSGLTCLWDSGTTDRMIK